MSAAKFAVRDLLVDPNAPRWVVADKGSTWVTDRYVMVRGDLFRQLPKSRPTPARPTLPVSAARTLLAMARGVGKPLISTTVQLVRDGRGDSARAWRVGAAVIFLNERVTRTFYLAKLRPRYIGGEQIVAWYGTKRGRDVLMAIQKPVVPFSLKFDELEECAPMSSPKPTTEDALAAVGVARARFNEAAGVTADGQANDCSHLSASGVDTTPVSDPGKVWRCDHCGLMWSAVSRGRKAQQRTRLFRGTVDGRDVLITLHDPEGYGEIAFRDAGRWGVPSELHEVE